MSRRAAFANSKKAGLFKRDGIRTNNEVFDSLFESFRLVRI